MHSKRKSKAIVEEGDEDPSFQDEEDAEDAPIKKKAKKEPKSKPAEAAEASGEIQVNQDGEKYVALGKNRRVTIRKFNGKPLIDIREYYVDKEEKQKPGKKGISLSPEQWEALKQCLPKIDEALASL